ncbi:hypothetical protein RIF29_18402 [Crotalaria pallida]|uniref:Transmembrane protein n=1 Tax=Crotalaria pallida TaxID=3830 RepID=A0AAN9FL60_CROPI
MVMVMVMVGFTITNSLFKPSSLSLPSNFSPFSSSSSFPFFKSQPFLFPKPKQPILLSASNNNNNNGDLKEQQGNNGSNGEQDDVSNNSNTQERPLFSSFKWSSLLDPDPDNILALGLTALLTWASVQVLCQLLFISFAILVAALKYSFIAALLLFILITLL